MQEKQNDGELKRGLCHDDDKSQAKDRGLERDRPVTDFADLARKKGSGIFRADSMKRAA